jgi:hypothetical protein
MHLAHDRILGQRLIRYSRTRLTWPWHPVGPVRLPFKVRAATLSRTVHGIPEGRGQCVISQRMGALPNAKTWAEYHYGVGPYVDGLFGQGNFGVVTKMGFHLLPAPDAYLTGTVIVPKREDIIPLVEGCNRLEHGGVIGMPEYGSPLGGFGPPDPKLREIMAKPGGPDISELEEYAARDNRGFFSVTVQFYGAPKVVQAQWEYAKEVFGGIRGVKFQDWQYIKFPATPEHLEKAHKVAIGVPNLSIFTIGARSAFNPSPSDGHRWFSPSSPRRASPSWKPRMCS